MLKKLKITSQNKILVISFIIFVFLCLILNFRTKDQDAAKVKKPIYADTLIPPGQVLIPVELANIQTVSALIDQFGIIDLYAGTEKDSILLANRIKILRAPLNPNQFAVMVSENLSKEIMKYRGPYRAVVQNRFDQEEQQLTQTANTVKNKKNSEAQQAIEIEYPPELN